MADGREHSASDRNYDRVRFKQRSIDIFSNNFGKARVSRGRQSYFIFRESLANTHFAPANAAQLLAHLHVTFAN